MLKLRSRSDKAPCPWTQHRGTPIRGLPHRPGAAVGDTHRRDTHQRPAPQARGSRGGHTQEGHPSEACPTGQGQLSGTLTVSTVETKPLEGLRTGQLPHILVGNTEGDQAQNVPGPLTGSSTVSLPPDSPLLQMPPQ